MKMKKSNHKARYQALTLIVLSVISLGLSSCGQTSPKLTNEPPRVWAVKAGEAFTSEYDGICGDRAKYTLEKL